MNNLELGNYVITKNLEIGIVFDIYLGVGYDICDICLDDFDECILEHIRINVYHEYLGETNDKYCGTTYTLDELYDICDYTTYQILLDMDPNLLCLLWKSAYVSKKSNGLCINFQDLITLYYSNPREAMQYLPIRKILSKNIVLFADGSIWKCRKIKQSRNSRNKYYYVVQQKIK